MSPGERVVAIASAETDKINLIGRGVYVGNEISPFDHTHNPKIELDDGNVVWGFQCWWGAEEKFEGWAKDREVVQVDVKAFLEEWESTLAGIENRLRGDN